MSLLDQFGREIKKGRPILEEIGGVSGIRDRYSSYPSQGLTPEKLTAIFKEADQGDVLRLGELYEEMEEKDAHLGAVLQTRKLAVTGLEWEVVAASKDTADEKIAQFVREALGWVENWDDALVGILDAVGKGFSVSEIMWEVDGSRVWCKDIRWRHQKKFTFYSKDGVLDVPRLLTNEQPAYGDELPPNKFIYHRAGGRAGVAPRGGVLRACAWMYLFKNYTIKDWVIFNERFAMPMRVGKYQPGASDEEKKVLRNAVFNLGSDAAAVISESTMIELLEGRKNGSIAGYEKLTAYCNAALSKAVLGHSASADSTPGKLGSEQEARDVRRDILEADARALAKTVKMQLIYPLVLFNFGADANLPSFRFTVGESEDLDKTASTIKTLGESGLRIPASHVYKKFGIPQPEGDEEVLERPASQSGPLPFKQKPECGCGRDHGPTRRMAMAAGDDEPDWIGTYLERIEPSLKDVKEDALRRVEEYLASQTELPSFEEFDAAMQARLGEAYAGIDRKAITDAVSAMYSWYKLTDTLGPALDVAFGGADVRTVDFLSRLDGYYLSKFIQNPEAKSALTEFLKERYHEGGEGLFGRGDPATVQEMKDLLSQRLTDISAGQIDRIVDTAVQRNRNWAHVSQLNDAGVVELEILEPTQDCLFCHSMHGQFIRVDIAHQRVQDLSAMKEEEFEAELKAEANRPVVGNEAAFVAKGMVPPYHPFCHGRFRMRIVR